MNNVISIKQYRKSKGKQITKELLDKINSGDSVKVNNWNEPLTVKGVSENYIVMAVGDKYSIIEKKPFPHTYNACEKGYFTASMDDSLFGFMDKEFDLSDPNMKQYRFDDLNWMSEYLEALENGRENDGINISKRNGVAIKSLQVKTV